MPSPSRFRRVLSFLSRSFFMVRSFAVAAVLSCLVAPAWAQAQPVTGTAATQTTALATKSAVNKPVPKTKTTAKPAGPGENGPCQIGVIPVIGDRFVVQTIGLTVFGNERAEVPIDRWGLDDLVVARVRAAAGSGVAVRRITYPDNPFANQEQPSGLFSRNEKTGLSDIVRQVAGSIHCNRYVLVTKFATAFRSPNQPAFGIGILRHGNNLLGHTFVFASTYIRVFDGRDYTVIKQGAASTDANPSELLGLLAGVGQPFREVDRASYPETPEAVNRNPVLLDGARALLLTSLDNTLPRLLKP
jgi:hypothetical protein